MKVNLFIVGACKSGTSFLHSYLGNHKSVYPSNPKEPYYFELPKSNRNEKEYLGKYFTNFKNEKYLLDGRHRNMFFKSIPKEIYNYNKDSKIIFILRNPIDRAFSHWWMWYSRKIIFKNFYQTIKEELSRIQKKQYIMDISPEEYILYIKNKAPKNRITYADSNTIVESGLYYQQISNFKKYFNSKNILILNFEDLKDSVKLNNKLSEFLNISFDSTITLVKINEAPTFKKSYSLSINKLIPKSIKNFVKSKFLRKPKVSKKANDLLYNFYKDENKKLIDELNLKFVKDWFK